MTKNDALEIAARVWCDQSMKGYVLDVGAVEEIAEIILFTVTKQDRLRDKEKQ